MIFGLTRKGILTALGAILLAWAAFAFGFVCSLHSKSAPSADVRQSYLKRAGDAPPAVRAGVLTALRDFQDGYAKRDPAELPSFMEHLFPQNEDVLLLGTDGNEWVRGYPAVAQFIKTDWMRWGDFRFAVDDSLVWSSGDVAWTTSVGSLTNERSDRPLRVSAVLTRKGDAWQFRQVHFQWDDRDARPADLMHPGTYLELVKVARRYVRGREK